MLAMMFHSQFKVNLHPYLNVIALHKGQMLKLIFSSRAPSIPKIPSVPTREEVETTESAIEKLRRTRAIADIESSGFNQSTFSSSASAKLAAISLPGEGSRQVIY